MNASRVTGNTAPEEPTALHQDLGVGLEAAAGDDHAVWARAALTALDDIRAESAPGGVPEAGPEPSSARDRAGVEGEALGGIRPAEPLGRPAPTGMLREAAGDSLGRGESGAPPGAVDRTVAGGPGADAPRRALGDDGAASTGGSAPDGAATGGAAGRDRFRSAGAPVRGGSTSGAVRRGGVDPVKGLIHRHRELCEQAVDPLEIAAGLEAHGLTDRTAARFRHRDVFSLAEEMFARAERVPATTDDRPARAADSRAGRAGPYLTPLLPGVVCALAVAGTAATEGAARLASGAIGALATGLALLFALRSGPLRARGRTLPAARLWTLWLLLYAAGGQALTAEVVAGGPDGLWPLTPAPVVALALAVAPAAWCADLFAARARRRLGPSCGLDDFAAGTRPLLLAVLLLYVAALGALVALTGLVLPGAGTLGPAAVLGTLLFLARLLVVHGFPEPASAALAAACAVEVAAPALLLSGRLPGLDLVARPVEALVGAWGVAAVPVLACGATALGLAAHAFAVLARASAHTR
ncbi:hypothetical protein HW130_17940 [Streptomyces sp. PKU-EA00015]|uniref:hypothetical protein n=1 Tax=Streptomyces sp. PKU-EA00015 TaxID=2748326 RepID=UPI0015A37D9C|nr:hypothetical protein [Streptomyces sp. PKU-EA00015]NWF28125.1 hypothetical protein [Streptomyces sp. PKU-EA00015]